MAVITMKLYVGTSGYSYKEWKGGFYPEKIAPAEMLSYYAQRLPAVELNNTFYRLPPPGVIENWRSQVPENFRFSVKVPRWLTHAKWLKDVGVATNEMLTAVSAFEKRLGVLLFRFPDHLEKDLQRLKGFLGALPAGTAAAFDFRHPTWFDDEVTELLRSAKRVAVVSDTEELPATSITKTADWGYVRLRRMRYSAKELKEWTKRIKAQKWKTAYVFFKHDDEGTGPKLAAQFISLNSDPA